MESVLGKYFDTEQERAFENTPDRIFLTIKNNSTSDVSINLFDLNTFNAITYSYIFNGFTSNPASTSSDISIVVNGVNTTLVTNGAGSFTTTTAQLITLLNGLGQGTWNTYFNGTDNIIYNTSGTASFGDLTTSQVIGIFNIQNVTPVTTGDVGALTITGSVSYNELQFAQVGSAYKINRLWAQSTNSEQLLQPLDIRYTNDNGNRKEYFYNPLFDPYQNNNIAMRPAKFDDFTLNSDTIIANYIVLGSATITILLDYTKASPDKQNSVENPINNETLPEQKQVLTVTKKQGKINHWIID